MYMIRYVNKLLLLLLKAKRASDVQCSKGSFTLQQQRHNLM